MKKAYIFPGQGSQFVGMGKDLYESSAIAKEMFESANQILGFTITDIMFAGTDEELKQTKVTQPAIFLHSVILSVVKNEDFHHMRSARDRSFFNFPLFFSVWAIRIAFFAISSSSSGIKSFCSAKSKQAAVFSGLSQ